jgi:hypothetical protein
MKKRIAAGVVGTIAVLGLAYIPASPLEPGFEAPKDRVVHIKEAEDAALKVLHEITPGCEAQGKAAEAWAEINSLQPKGYEVIGECTG